MTLEVGEGEEAGTETADMTETGDTGEVEIETETGIMTEARLLPKWQ